MKIFIKGGLKITAIYKKYYTIKLINDNIFLYGNNRVFLPFVYMRKEIKVLKDIEGKIIVLEDISCNHRWSKF